jgi:hypothetical protein
MAIKGIGIEPEVYLLPGYANPEDYATPHHTSFGDYATPQTYFEADYVLNAQDLVSTFTIQAEGTVFSTSSSSDSVFSMSVTYERVRNTDPIALSTDTQVSITGRLDFDFAVLQTFRAFTPRFLRAVVTDIGHMPDATWNTYAESDFIDRTWDDFSDYKWDFLQDFFIRSTITKATGGYLVNATASITAFANSSLSFSRFRGDVITPPSVSTMSVDANYITAAPATMEAAFAQTGSVSRFRGVLFSNQAQQFTAINTTSVNANFTSRSTLVEYTGRVTVSGNATTVFDITKTLSLAFEQQADANYNVAVGSTSLTALYSKITVGRLISLPDPFNTIKVPQEIRTLVVPIENNIIEVLGETRVNKVITETRAIKVKQETRNFKIMRPGFTDRSSIPRVRQET